MKKKFDLWVHSHPTLKKLIMELKIAFLIIMASVSNVLATPGYSQVTRVSLDMENTRLENVLDKIETQSEFYFIFNQKQIDVNRVVSIQVENKLITDILPELFKGTNVNYVVFDRKILLTNDPLDDNLLALKSGTELQQVTVRGTVTDASTGEALPGVNVVVRRTIIGAITDVNGSYTLEVLNASATLQFSFIGYVTQEIALGGQTTLNVALISNVAQLSEVVIVGYETQKKEDITGSVAIVDMDALKSIPTGSAIQALQGQASGVNIIRSGVPGGSSNIFVRGLSSFGDTQPLVLVDGMESNLNNISANDIESMQVLKDAGTAAIYGVRGSNGVIIVTTKKGKLGVPTITYDTYYSIQLPLKGNVFNLLNSQDFATLSKLLNPNTALFQNGLPDFLYRGPEGAGVAMAGDAAVDPSKYNLDPSNSSNNYLIQKVNKIGTDWFHEIFKEAPMQNHNLTVSGGTEKTNYLLSLGYLNQQGTLTETFLKRYSVRINTSYKIKKNIRIGQNAYIFYKQNENLSEGNPIEWTYRMMPIIPAYDIKGNYGGTFAGPELGSSSNPLAVQKNKINNRNNTWDVLGNVYAEFDFLKHFTARTSFGGTLDYNFNNNFNFTPYNNTEGNNNPNSLTEGADYNTNTTWTNIITYSNLFGKHNIKILAGSEAISSYGKSVTGSSQGLFSTNYDYLFLGNGTSNVTNSSSAYADALFSLFSHLDYSYNDKYLLGFTVRRDGSSRFGSEKRFGVFPSVSLGWRLSKEGFMENMSWVNDLKLRGSYGILGSQNNVSPNNAFSLYGSGYSNSYYDITGSTNSIRQGFYQTRIGNPRTEWEQDVISNVGFDASILNNKIDFSLEYYKKSTKGLLFAKTLPASVGGATPPTVNIGDIQNTGFDVSAGYRGIVNNNLQFNIQTNITTYKNLVVNIPGSGYFDDATTQVLGTVVRNQIGHPISSFFGYDVVGLFKDAEDVTKSPAQDGAAPGYFKYKDVNGDGKITSDDRTFLGSPNPDFTYGINLGISYKSFDFSAILYGSKGNKVFNSIRTYTDFFSTYAGGKSNVLLNAWTPENTNTNIPKIDAQSSFSSSGVVNSYYIEDGSYLRLRSLIVGYVIKPIILQKYGINKLRIYCQASNLFTITKYTGLDPEVGGSSSAFGVDYANYPSNEQNFLFGVIISF